MPPPTPTSYLPQAVVRALKAKRDSRRRPSKTTDSGSSSNSDKISNNQSLERKQSNGDPASLARANADEADAILNRLRLGLGLRDEVVIAAEAGKLERGKFCLSCCFAGWDE